MSERLTLSLLRAYKTFLSPLLPRVCRFHPTCSEYARQAVQRFGALRGSWMALCRLLRCQPFCRGGFDPVDSPGSTNPQRDPSQ
ncbi:MAG: membrane protein insertion efficiency factor YidD [Planctomycetota bacterium]|nr:membrane protein insertion efficiency factor YidD [Planctomycetota bacterium]